MITRRTAVFIKNFNIDKNMDNNIDINIAENQTIFNRLVELYITDRDTCIKVCNDILDNSGNLIEKVKQFRHVPPHIVSVKADNNGCEFVLSKPTACKNHSVFKYTHWWMSWDKIGKLIFEEYDKNINRDSL